MNRPDPTRFRLQLPRIEAKSRRVRLEGWKDHADIGKSPSLRTELDEIIEGIGRGGGVAEKYYRAGIDHDRDELLEQRGIMHLHQGGKNSYTLIFLVQYADLVLLLESNSHVHFRTNPKGKNIAALIQAWFLELEREMVEAEQMVQAAATSVARQAAAEHRLKLAVSLARLKREEGRFIPTGVNSDTLAAFPASSWPA